MTDPYQKIAEETIKKAEQVGGSLQDFADGLRLITDEVWERWTLAEAEAEAEA